VAVAKRSPILGYNHNVRHRGLVFHVQTEDSGIVNPHLFTHLFFGGTILATRKLVYDNEAAEESVKSLMQAQHKAVLRDLKRNVFDDKIEQYLGHEPGLLPRDAPASYEDDGAGDTPPARPVPGLTPPPPMAAPMAASGVAPGTPAAAALIANRPRRPTPGVDVPLVRFASTTTVSADPIAISRAATEKASVVPPPAHAAHGTPVAISIPPPVLPPGATMPKAGVPRGTPQVPLPPLPPVPPRKSEVHAVPVPPPLAAEGGEEEVAPGQPISNRKRTEVSDAFDAMIGADGELDEEPAQIHSPAPQSAPPPPGVSPERVGTYAQHKRGAPRASQAPIATKAAVAPGQRNRSGLWPTGSSPTGPRPGVPAAAAAPPATGRSAPPPTTPPPSQQTRRPAPGGVVVSRPAVIVNAPPKMVGQPAAVAQSAHRPPPRRKTRDETDGGLFGQDLISEKSLDEVILAYLSEDSKDE
jgi:hypothetical protein